MYLIGTDEAGYGPNLGPLVVTATVWSIDEFDGGDLYSRLDGIVPSIDPEVFDADLHVAVGDSKALYSPALGLGALERGTLGLFASWKGWPTTWQMAWSLLAPIDCEEIGQVPWHAGYDEPLPVAVPRGEVVRAAAIVRRALASAGMRLVDVRSRVVFPALWNRLLVQAGNKATALSEVTLDLVAEVLAPLDGAVRVFCDKHGGRAYYQPLLQCRFPDVLVEVHREGREVSIYRTRTAEQSVEFRFCVNGEREVPIAVASMVSKYLRELAMRAFNRFWQSRVEGLRPTAGYPSDARRFRRDIALAQTAAAIADGVLWRER